MKPEIQPLAIYSLQELCDLLGIADATARRWIKKGKLPTTKVGRQYRVTGRAILQALEAHG